MDFNLTIETIINGSKQLYNQLSTGKKVDDFLPGDLVKCTYMQGIFRISEIYRTKIEVFPVDNTRDTFLIGPSFLVKADVNHTNIKILYER